MKIFIIGLIIAMLGPGGLVLAGDGEQPSLADLHQSTGDPVEDHIGATMYNALASEATQETRGQQTGVRERPATGQEYQAAQQQVGALSTQVNELETKFATKFIEVRKNMTDMTKEQAAERKKPGGELFIPGLEEAKSEENEALARDVEELRQLGQQYREASSQLGAAREVAKLRTEADIRAGISDAERDANTAKEALDYMTKDSETNPELVNEPGYYEKMNQLTDRYGKARQQADELKKQLDEKRYVGAESEGGQEVKTDGAKAEPETTPTTGALAPADTTPTTGVPADQGAARLSRQEQDKVDYQKLQELKKTQKTTADATTEAKADKTVTPEPETPPKPPGPETPPGPGGGGIDPETGRWEPVPQMVTRENEAYWQNVLNDPDKVLVPHGEAGVLVLTQKQLRDILTEKAVIDGWNEEQVKAVMGILGAFNTDGKRLVRDLYKGEGEIDYTRLDEIKPTQPIDLELGQTGGSAVGETAAEAKVETTVTPEPEEPSEPAEPGLAGGRRGLTPDDTEFWTQAVTDENRVIVPNLTDVSLTGDSEEGFIVMGAEQAQRYITAMALQKGMSAEQAEQLAKGIGEFNKLSKAVIQQWLKDPEKEFDFSAVPPLNLPQPGPEEGPPDEGVDLKDAEAAFDRDSDVDGDQEPLLEDLVEEKGEGTDSDLDRGLRRANRDLADASTSGDTDLLQADLVRDQGGAAAGRITDEAATQVVGEDAKTSWGATFGEAGQEVAEETGRRFGDAAGHVAADAVWNGDRTSGTGSSGTKVSSGGGSGGDEDLNEPVRRSGRRGHGKKKKTSKSGKKKSGSTSGHTHDAAGRDIYSPSAQSTPKSKGQSTATLDENLEPQFEPGQDFQNTTPGP